MPGIESEIIKFLREINTADTRIGGAVVEIGRRLQFVKDKGLIHGQWEPWLRSVNIAPVTARKYIQVYEQFGNRAMPIDLPLSKMFEMLPLPAKVSRDLFLKSKHLTDSGEKTVAEMTVKELRGVVRRERELAGLLPRKDSPASDPPSGHATDSTTDPFKALDLPEGYAEVLEKLPVCVARMLIPLSRDERLAMLDVAAQLSSLAFSENYPEILHSVRQNNSPSSIAASYKAPPKRQPMSGIFIDPYEILHVDECEDERVVRSKYRTLVKQLHPDVGGSDFLFKLVHEAWKDYQCSEY